MMPRAVELEKKEQKDLNLVVLDKKKNDFIFFNVLLKDYFGKPRMMLA